MFSGERTNFSTKVFMCYYVKIMVTLHVNGRGACVIPGYIFPDGHSLENITNIHASVYFRQTLGISLIHTHIQIYNQLGSVLKPQKCQGKFLRLQVRGKFTRRFHPDIGV